MKHIYRKAFTLVELLIVIGIIGILAVTLMVSLNPAEAQRKSRDAARLKDSNDLQSILEQALNDGITPCTAARCASNTSTATSFPCAANWLGVNLCSYARTIPGDPLNNRASNCTNSGGVRTANCMMAYYVMTNGTDYEINVRQESTSNASKVANDGGDNVNLVEITSGASLIGGALNP